MASSFFWAHRTAALIELIKPACKKLRRCIRSRSGKLAFPVGW